MHINICGIEILETNLIVTQIMEKLGLSLIYGCLQNSKSHKIVGIQIKLVHEISSQDLKPLVQNCCGLGVLISLLVFICMYMYS